MAYCWGNREKGREKEDGVTRDIDVQRGEWMGCR
jgi:hypothetical protein